MTKYIIEYLSEDMVEIGSSSIECLCLWDALFEAEHQVDNSSWYKYYQILEGGVIVYQSWCPEDFD